jgi:putative restriction endonuclease
MAARLRIDHSRGPAPHKPLLLLAVADLAEQGHLPQPLLPLTPELAFRFLSFWAIVAARRPQRPDIRLPFFHLSGDDGWTPLDETGQPTTERRRAVAAGLDPDFHACLLDPAGRDELRRILIARHFEPGERAALYDLVGLPVPAADMVKEDAARYTVSRQCGREARFRLTVVPAYNYTCALTGYRLTTIDAGSMVEAAHIHEFSDSRNNDPSNGLALCRNAHWAFDEGLWSLTDTCHVLVAAHRFDEAGPDAFLLKTMAGRLIHRPANPALLPDPRHLTWHRREHGFGE